MPTNQQIYDKLTAIEVLLMQLLDALNDDDNESIEHDLEGATIPLDRDINEEL